MYPLAVEMFDALNAEDFEDYIRAYETQRIELLHNLEYIDYMLKEWKKGLAKYKKREENMDKLIKKDKKKMDKMMDELIRKDVKQDKKLEKAVKRKKK